MDKKFLTAFVLPEYFDIYNYRLRPLCPKALIALYAIDSPFVKGVPPNEQDIVNFLRICSMDFDGLFKIKKMRWCDKYFFFKMKYWPPFKLRVMMCIKIFIEESMATPLVRIRSRHGQKQSVMIDKETLPEMLMLVSLMMSKFGMSEREALEVPIGRATCYSVAYAALEGSDIAVIPEEEASPEAIKEEIANHEKQMAERMRLAMANGKVPQRKIKTRTS